MEMEKFLECIVAKLDADRKTDKEEIKTNQAKMDADGKKDKKDFMKKLDADRKKDKEDIMKKLDAYQAMTDAILLALQVMETSHKEIVAKCKPETEIKTMACQEMETHLDEEELTSVTILLIGIQKFNVVE
jgi:heptaprenylglyceryl phosphate synthase